MRVAYQTLLAWRRRGGQSVAIVQVVLLRALAQGVNVCTGLLSAALLGPAGRGALAALTTGPGFLAGVASLGLHASLIYHMRACPEQEREYVGNGMLLTAASGILAAGIGWLLMPVWLAHYPPETVAVGRLLIWATPLTIVTWTMTGAAEARGWFGFANRTLSLQSTAILVMLLVLWRLHALTARTAAFAYLFPTVPVFVYFLFSTVRSIRPRFVPRARVLGNLLHYGTRICGVDLLSTCSAYADQILVVAVLPPATMGAYIVALSAARLLTVIQSGVIAVLFPRVAAGEPAQVVHEVTSCFRVFIVITGCAATALAFAGPKLLLLIYGPAFAPAISPFRLLLVATVLADGSGVLAQAYAACGRPGLVSLGEGAGFALSLLLLIILVPRLGTTGAAASVLGSAAFRLGAFALGLRMLAGATPRLLPWPRDVLSVWYSLRQTGGPHAVLAPAATEPVP